MSERGTIGSPMLETYRGLALRTAQADSYIWKLFGYIDWLEDRMDDLRPEWRQEL